MLNLYTNKTRMLFSLFVNERTGLIRNIKCLDNIYLPIDFYVYSAVLQTQPKSKPFDLNPLSIAGAGKSKEEAITKCLGESIERYCGYYASTWKEKIYASYNEISKEAIAPEKFALFSESQYKQPDFYFKKFNEKTKILWIKGRNLVSGESIYVPAQLCFLSMSLNNDVNLCYSTSTGLACGRSYEEAVEKAIYEVIERDAFMIMWLNEIKFPAINSKFKKESWLKNTLSNMKSTDYEIYTFILDNYTGISTYLTITLNTKNKSPLASFGAASDLNEDRAIEKSIIESLHCLSFLFQSDRDGLKIKINQGNTVIKSFDDHALLYKNPDRSEHLSFLIDKLENRKYEYKHDDPKSNNLNDLVDLLKQRGYEIIIVDLTPEKFKELDFWVVKVLIPGFVDLSLGDWILKGAERIYEIPEKLGFKRKRENELNSNYHPFP